MLLSFHCDLRQVLSGIICKFQQITPIRNSQHILQCDGNYYMGKRVMKIGQHLTKSQNKRGTFYGSRCIVTSVAVCASAGSRIINLTLSHGHHSTVRRRCSIIFVN